MNPDPIANAARAARRNRQAGDTPAMCIDCGETDINALELDHLVSSAHDPDLTGWRCRNCHAKKHAQQRDDGVDVRHDPPPNLLQRAAAWLLTIGRLLISLGESAMRYGQQVAQLHGWLETQHPSWAADYALAAGPGT